MNAPFRKLDFAPQFEPPLARPDHLCIGAGPGRDRVIGAAITVAAHVAVAVALVLGFHAARPLLMPEPIMVSVQEKHVEHETLDIVMPKFVAPPQVDVPVPMFNIVPGANAITATPPQASPVASAPPAPGPVRDTGETRATYLGSLLAQLNRFKHYPPQARSAHIEGVVMLHFIVDRGGKVLSAEIARSSGRAALDREALALIDRAQPLPAMPADMTGDTLDAVVPVNFALH